MRARGAAQCDDELTAPPEMALRELGLTSSPHRRASPPVRVWCVRGVRARAANCAAHRDEPAACDATRALTAARKDGTLADELERLEEVRAEAVKAAGRGWLRAFRAALTQAADDATQTLCFEASGRETGSEIRIVIRRGTEIRMSRRRLRRLRGRRRNVLRFGGYFPSLVVVVVVVVFFFVVVVVLVAAFRRRFDVLCRERNVAVSSRNVAVSSRRPLDAANSGASASHEPPERVGGGSPNDAFGQKRSLAFSRKGGALRRRDVRGKGVLNAFPWKRA